jgi:drug/metabolite transporter (DMT)-like permease
MELVSVLWYTSPIRVRENMGSGAFMQREMLVAIGAGLGGMLGWGFSEFGTKKSVDRTGALYSLVWAHVLGTLLLFGVLFLRTFVVNASVILPSGPSDWLRFLLFGSLQTTVYYFAYRAFEKGQVSVLSPVFASFSGLVAIASVLVFGERINAGFAPALGLVFGGMLLINLDVGSLRASGIRLKAVAGLKEILIATVLAACWTLGWDRFTEHKDWMLCTTLMFVFMTLSAFLIAHFAHVNLLPRASLGTWRFMWLIAVGEVVAYLAITLGYSSTTHASVVALLSGASSLPTMILARIFIKERIAVTQTIGGLVVIAGVILLSVN